MKKETPVKKEIKLSAKAKRAIADFQEEEEGGKIENILALYVAGVPPLKIIELGFNKTTVYRQTGELKKLQKGPAVQYYGFELYEARIQRIMSAKKVTREAAVNLIAGLDISDAKKTK